MVSKYILLTILLLLNITVYAQPALKYAIVSKHNRQLHQVIDTAGNVIVDSILAPKCAEYYGCRYNEGVFRFMRDGKYGYKNIRNQVLVAAQFDDVGDMVQGSGIVTVGNTMGLINRQGHWVFKPDFIFLSYADTTGLIIAVDRSNNLFLLTARGDTILGPKYKPFHERPAFVEGLLGVSRGPNVGFITRSGRFYEWLCFAGTEGERQNSLPPAYASRGVIDL